MIPATSGLSASSSEKTHFTNKIGDFSPAAETVTWTADNGVRIVAHVKGRGTLFKYPQYTNGNHLNVMIALAKEAFEVRGEGIFSQTFVKGIWPFQRTIHWHLVFDPRLVPIVTSFSRHPAEDAESDLSTPYNCSITRKTAHSLGLHLSTLNLSAEPYAVVHKSIEDYFNEGRHNYQEWAKFADEQFFKPWSSSNEFINGHESFSKLTWATVSKFVLGISEAEFVDYSYIWNNFLQSSKSKGALSIITTKAWCYSGMEAFLLEKVRQNITTFKANPSAPSETIIHFWLKQNMAHVLIEKLPRSQYQTARETAEAKGMTLEEMIYLNNFIIVMIGMQENMAFVLTQIGYHFARDPSLREKCAGNPDACKDMVLETLRYMPPAGIAREVRWDTDLFDPISGNTYRVNKGDQFITMPAVTQHLGPFSTDPAHFDMNRPYTNPNAFSAGPHRCPGQMPALSWLYQLTLLMAQYKFTREEEEHPDYYVSFILRDGDMKLKMSL